jgi:hypothetical protein
MEFMTIACPLKDAASRIFDLPYRVFDDPGLKDTVHEKLGCKPREVILLLGELMQKVLSKPNGYIGSNSLLDRVMHVAADPTKSVCITDLRLPVESDEFKKAGITRIRIKNDRVRSNDTHYTEAGCQFDLEVDNSGTLEEFYAGIDKALGLGKKKRKREEDEEMLEFRADPNCYETWPCQHSVQEHGGCLGLFQPSGVKRMYEERGLEHPVWLFSCLRSEREAHDQIKGWDDELLWCVPRANPDRVPPLLSVGETEL